MPTIQMAAVQAAQVTMFGLAGCDTTSGAGNDVPSAATL